MALTDYSMEVNDVGVHLVVHDATVPDIITPDTVQAGLRGYKLKHCHSN